MTIAVWATQRGCPANVADDARLRGPADSDGNHPWVRQDNFWGQAGWHMGMRWNDFDDLAGQLRRGAPVPDWIEQQERDNSGCTWVQALYGRPPYVQQCSGPNRAVVRGEIHRLALNMHGRPGVLLVDRSANLPNGDPAPGLDVASFPRYQARMQTILEFTTSTAVILFMGCTAGVGRPGTELLRRFSAVWPSRTFVAFTTIGVQMPGVMHQNRPGETAGGLEATEPGMRDSNVTQPQPNHDYGTTIVVGGREMSEWESFPWASDTSPHAKVIRGGQILRWGGDTPERPS